MKKLIIYTIITFCTAFAVAQQTMYIMKGGKSEKFVLNTDVDSLTFYAPPPPPPVKVSGITLTPPTIIYVGDVINLSNYINIAPANASDKTVTWSTNNNNNTILNITNPTTGAATAVSAGSVIIRATANDGSGITNTMTLIVSAETPNTYYKGFIPNAAYIGRWFRKTKSVNFTPVEVDQSFHHGAMIKVNFTGNNVALTVSGDSKFSVKIDNGNWKYITPSGWNMVDVSITPTGGLGGAPTDEHSLLIVAGEVGNISGNGFLVLSGIKLDSGAVTRPPNINTKHIEFIGDSISTLGYSPDSNIGQHWNWLIAEATGWEHSHITMPGIKLSEMLSVYELEFASQNASFFNNPNPQYNFDLYTPDAVVINLGHNQGATTEQCKAFLQMIRSHYKEAKIIALGLFDINRTADRANMQAAVNELKNLGDQNIHYLYDAAASVGFHPTVQESANTAAVLTPQIKQILNIP